MHSIKKCLLNENGLQHFQTSFGKILQCVGGIFRKYKWRPLSPKIRKRKIDFALVFATIFFRISKLTRQPFIFVSRTKYPFMQTKARISCICGVNFNAQLNKMMNGCHEKLVIYSISHHRKFSFFKPYFPKGMGEKKVLLFLQSIHTRVLLL